MESLLEVLRVTCLLQTGGILPYSCGVPMGLEVRFTREEMNTLGRQKVQHEVGLVERDLASSLPRTT